MSVETISNLERKVVLNISKDLIKDNVQVELKKYAKKTKIQGFRPGKAPKHIVEQMYGARAYEDSLNEQLKKIFTQNIVENKLNIVGYPKFDLTSSDGDDFVFSAIFEVMPEVKIGDLTAKEIEKPIYNLTDADIEKTIGILRKQRAPYEDSNTDAANGDRVTIDFVGKIDGVEFDGGKAEDYQFVLGQGQMLADFEYGIVGMSLGESKDIQVRFPDDYHAENLKGKLAIFNINLKKVACQKLPELDKEFIQSVGVMAGTEDALHSEIKLNLELEVERRIRHRARNNALQALLEVSPFDVPNALVSEEIEQMIRDTEEKMKHQGYKPEQIKLTHDMFEKDAKHIVTLRLLVREVIRENNIDATDEDVRKVVIARATMYDDADDYVKWYYQDIARVNNAKALAVEQKVIDWIYSKALAKDVFISYEEVMK